MNQHGDIKIQNLSVFYGGHRALDNINISIPHNQITAIIGPSGCGKSTLLKSMNRLLENSGEVKISGSVFIDGEDIYRSGVEVTHLRRKMGLLSQRPQVLPMSIFDNVAYGPRIHGIRNRRRLSEIVEYYLKMASLWEEVRDRLYTPAVRLSIGQQQRLCLARGLAVEPGIILGDEPTSALDPQSSQNVEECLMRLKKDYTIIFVTHILRQARRIADFVIFMYLGRIIEAGPAEQFFGEPQGDLTRQYVQGMIS